MERCWMRRVWLAWKREEGRVERSMLRMEMEDMGMLFQSVMRRSWLRVERMLRVARVAEEEVLVRRMVRVAVSGMPKAVP